MADRLSSAVSSAYDVIVVGAEATVGTNVPLAFPETLKSSEQAAAVIGVMEHVFDVEASPLQNVTEAGVNTKPQLAVGVTVMHVLGYAGRLLTEIL